MDLNLLKRLIRIVEKSEITEFAVEEGDLKVKISKACDHKNHFMTQVPEMVYPQAIAPQNGFAAPAAPTEPKAEPTQTEEKIEYHEIRSPIVGTFYRAPAPDADQYVQIGDTISEGSVLCIVEAMKLMNEIESDISGKIVKILVGDATPVEYNQPLFLVDRG